MLGGIKLLNSMDCLVEYGVESFRLISNAIISFLYNNDYQIAIRYINSLEEYELEEKFVYERIFQRFFNCIKKKLQGYPNKSWVLDMENIYIVLETLGMDRTKEMMREVIEKLQEENG